MNKTDDALWIGLVSVIVFLTYLPNLFLSFRRWRQEHGTPTAYRGIRGLFQAGILTVFGLAVMTGSLQRIAPDVEWIVGPSTVVRIIALVLLLIGGLVLWATWIVEDRRHRA